MLACLMCRLTIGVRLLAGLYKIRRDLMVATGSRPASRLLASSLTTWQSRTARLRPFAAVEATPLCDVGPHGRSHASTADTLVLTRCPLKGHKKTAILGSGRFTRDDRAFLERKTGFEPATFSLARLFIPHSAIPHYCRIPAKIPVTAR